MRPQTIGAHCSHWHRWADARCSQDVTTLKLTPSPEASSSDAPESLSRSSTLTTARSSFLCPLTQRAMNGRARFVYMGRCGCVMSEQGLRATCTPASSSSKRKAAPEQDEAAGSGSGSDQEGSEKGKDMQPCPLCATPFDAAVLAKGEVSPTGEVVVLNPTAEEEAPMRAAMEARRAIEAKEKAERKSKSKKLDAGVEGGEDEAEKQRRKEEKKARKAEAAAMLAAALEEGPGSKRQKLEGPSVETMNAGAGAGSAAAAIMAKAKKEGDKKEMSPALRSMYGLDLDKRKKVGSDWMVRGTFGR